MKQEDKRYDYNAADWEVNVEAYHPSCQYSYTHATTRTIYLHHLQDTLSVNTPPSNGPSTDANPNIAPNAPWKTGRLSKGTVCTMMITVPENKPANPRPATARPAMRVAEEGAAPQSAEPISKMVRQDLGGARQWAAQFSEN